MSADNERMAGQRGALLYVENDRGAIEIFATPEALGGSFVHRGEKDMTDQNENRRLQAETEFAEAVKAFIEGRISEGHTREEAKEQASNIIAQFARSQFTLVPR